MVSKPWEHIAYLGTHRTLVSRPGEDIAYLGTRGQLVSKPREDIAYLETHMKLKPKSKPKSKPKQKILKEIAELPTHTNAEEEMTANALKKLDEEEQQEIAQVENAYYIKIDKINKTTELIAVKMKENKPTSKGTKEDIKFNSRN